MTKAEYDELCERRGWRILDANYQNFTSEEFEKLMDELLEGAKEYKPKEGDLTMKAKARWVNANTGTTFKCSKCGEEPMYAPHKGMCFVTLTKFCPNCGAEMDLTDYDDEEDEDAGD